MRNNPSKTKKAVSVLALAGILIACFVGPVNAASTTYPWYYTSRSNTKAVDYTSVFVSAYQFSPYNGEVAFEYSANSTDVVIQSEIMFVTVQIRNFGTSTKYINGLTINLLSNAETGLMAQYQNEILDVDYIIRDFYVMPAGANDGTFTFYPSAEWGYNGYICVPVNTTLVCQFKIKLPTWNVTPSNFSNYNSQLYTVSIGDYRAYDVDFTPNGSHEDIIAAINDNAADIIAAITANSSTNTDVSNDSGTLTTQSNAVHSQEAAYYTANTQAIEATGLSNYQFSTSQSNGIGAVRNDFVAIWNAMDGWTSVYIFSLTLGLALTIIRHAPSAISRRRRRSKE